jgi:predicted dienelactone hydrolase
MLKVTMSAAAIVLGVFATAGQATDVPGYDRITVKAGHRAGLVAGSLWYPAGGVTYQGLVGDDQVFQGVAAMVGAPPQDGRHPLVVLSHGSGGNMDNLGWLSGALAQRGAIVLAVNHPGSTSGDSSPRRSIEVWDRPMDLSAALDQVLADPLWAARIDPARITAVGFSMGGLTALQMGGIRTDIAAYRAYCDKGLRGAGDCGFFARGGVDLGAVPAEAFGQDLRDARVGRVVAIDPGMGHAMTQASLAGNTVATELISLGTDDTIWAAVNIGPKGSNLSGRMAMAGHVEIAPADHFTFLALCKPGAAKILQEVGEDPICDDPEGADRGDVHARVIAAIAGFVGL